MAKLAKKAILLPFLIFVFFIGWFLIFMGIKEQAPKGSSKQKRGETIEFEVLHPQATVIQPRRS
ncbi:MAG: hypothetical protein NWE96_08865 [Candidatus Bathyarchaeota archaeon]|nr:hypothetical protein [Candidatus Bathyarchaeota archaeon]